MKERILITGASGFVGYHLIQEALQNNLEVFAAVRKSSQIDHLKEFDIQYINLDMNNVSNLQQQLFELKPDYIVHAAGITRARSVKEYNFINATNTYTLARAAYAANANLKKFVLISSLAAIGPLNNLNGIIDADTLPHPITAYGRSKLLAEKKLKDVEGLNYTILRPTGVYGPRDKDIFIFFQQLKKGLEPYIGRKPQKLSLIYVKDVARAAIKALYGGNHRTYNLSDGNFYNRYELGSLSKDILNLKTIKFHLPVIFVKIIAAVSEKVSSLGNKAAVLNSEKVNELMAPNWNCDIEPAKSELGFYPAYNLESGLIETLNWYKTNKWL